MALEPGYGETPVPGDELDALLHGVRELLGEPITRAAIYDLEQAVQEQVAEEQLIAVLEGSDTPLFSPVRPATRRLSENCAADPRLHPQKIGSALLPMWSSRDWTLFVGSFPS